MNQTTHTARAPYQVGDHVAALSHDARYGTCLVRNARVAAVERDTQRPGCPWLVTYQAGPDQQRTVRVNVSGMDTNGYVSPSTSVLSIEQATRPAAWVDAAAVPPGTDVVAVALPGLARSFGDPLPAGTLDAAADTMTYGDVVGYVPPTDPDADALVHDDAPGVTHADLVTWAVSGTSAPSGARALLRADAGVAPTLRAALGVWAQDGSVVLLGTEASGRHSSEDALARLVASERITAA